MQMINKVVKWKKSVKELHYHMDPVLLFSLKGSLYSKASSRGQFPANYTQMEEEQN